VRGSRPSSTADVESDLATATIFHFWWEAPPKGQWSGVHRVSLNPDDYNNLGNLLSLKKQLQQFQQIGFGHSSGKVEKQGASQVGNPARVKERAAPMLLRRVRIVFTGPGRKHRSWGALRFTPRAETPRGQRLRFTPARLQSLGPIVGASNVGPATVARCMAAF